MGRGDESRLGRRLMALRGRLASETDRKARGPLRLREMRLLAELGNTEAALEAADSLAADEPDWPRGLAAAADLRCRAGDWRGGEELFRRAAGAASERRDADGAERIRLGPLYRLLEARGAFREAADVAGGPSPLARVLLARARRLAGSPGIAVAVEGEGLAGRLAALEAAHRGASPRPLLELVRSWGGGEPEWRWRVLVEGVRLWESEGLETGAWRRPLRETDGPLPDPRYRRERRELESRL